MVVTLPPPPPIIFNQVALESKCTYTFKATCFSCPNKQQSYDYPMSSEPYTVLVEDVNACGKSVTEVTIPKAGPKCINIPRISNNKNQRIHLDINYEHLNQIIWVKSDKTYYEDFRIELLDAYGRVIYANKSSSSEISLDLYTVLQQAGAYYFRIYTNDGLQWNKKIIYATY